MQREYEEAALRDLESATAEHLSWVKRVNAALLFRTELSVAPAELPQVLKAWAEAPELSPSVAAERRQVFEALRRTRHEMLRQAARLAEATQGGAPIEPEQYHAFMGSAEGFARELRRLEQMLRQTMAETDPLTGVHNRLGMMRDLDREWQRSVRTGQPCCVALVDLDHFKCINDTYGHMAGDRVLSMAARFFVRRLRPYDRVYRYGGEEFLFILPNTDLAMAERVLNRLRSLMARLPVRVKDGTVLRVTASFGIAEMSSPEDTPNAVLARADRAVYAAKAAGRNQVRTEAEVESDDRIGSDDMPALPAGLPPPQGIRSPLHR